MSYIVQRTVRGRDNRAVGSPAGRENMSGGGVPPIQFRAANELGTAVSTTITRVSNVATASATAHGLTVGDIVRVSGANETEFNGDFRVDSTADANTYTYGVFAAVVTSPATGTITSQKVKDKAPE